MKTVGAFVRAKVAKRKQSTRAKWRLQRVHAVVCAHRA
jgi:hypothetical protein